MAVSHAVHPDWHPDARHRRRSAAGGLQRHSRDPDLGPCLGVGAALAGAGGIVYALTNNLDPSSVPTVGLSVFPAIILGGLDTYLGVFVGALVLGALDSVIGVTFGGQWQDPVAYIVLVVVLLIRPRGLFGSREIVRI